MGGTDLIDRLRKPQYTGENRCLPCTVVNAVLACAVATVVAVAVGGWVGSAAGTLAGAAALGLAAASIYLRGYLVPGTPWLTRTYFPDWLLRWFEKGDAVGGAGGADPDAEVDVEAALVRAGAVAPCEHEDDLCLTDDFGAAWHDRIAGVRDEDASRGALAELLGVDGDRLRVDEYGTALVARLDGARVGQWESRAAFLADVAAAAELEDRLAAWRDLGVQQRGQVLHGLRLFLDRCPACEGVATAGQETVESCCRSVDVVAVSCRDCGARLFEVEHPGPGPGEGTA